MEQLRSRNKRQKVIRRVPMFLLFTIFCLFLKFFFWPSLLFWNGQFFLNISLLQKNKITPKVNNKHFASQYCCFSGSGIFAPKIGARAQEKAVLVQQLTIVLKSILVARVAAALKVVLGAESTHTHTHKMMMVQEKEEPVHWAKLVVPPPGNAPSLCRATPSLTTFFFFFYFGS